MPSDWTCNSKVTLIFATLCPLLGDYYENKMSFSILEHYFAVV